MREKLIELIVDAKRTDPETGSLTEYIADHLIANGVTIQEWIPVSEQEEPTENGTYLCHGYWIGSGRNQTETADFIGEWDIANNFILTHWMPFPMPSKGEADA